MFHEGEDIFTVCSCVDSVFVLNEDGVDVWGVGDVFGKVLIIFNFILGNCPLYF